MRHQLAVPATLVMLAVFVVSVSALAGCDDAFLFGPPRTIDTGEGEGEGALGEGEGEGEGEGAASHDVCGGAFTVVSSPPIAMGSTRARHSAVLLADGRVLLAGGHDDSFESVATAEIFDPSTGAFAPTAPMHQARYDFALAALDDGRVLAAGGFNNDSATPDDNGDLTTTELFDPSTEQWTVGPAMPEARSGLSAVTVAGQTFIFGGTTNAASIPVDVLQFNSADDSLTQTTGHIAEHGTSHTAHTTADGRILMVGGYFTGSLADVDIVFGDGHTAPAAAIPGARRSACAANDDRGRTLFFGGYNADALTDIEAFDPNGNAWVSPGDLGTARYACEAATLSCLALVCGGVGTTSCEAWDFATESAVPVVDDMGGEYSLTLTALDDTHALVAGGFVGDLALSGTAHVISLVAAP